MGTDLFRTLDVKNRRAFSLAGRDGKTYRLRLISTVQEIEKSLRNVLPSNYLSSIGSTNYGIALRSYAIEFAKIRMALEDIQGDGYITTEAYSSLRADLLYQNLGSLLAVDKHLNLSIFTSQEFHAFLLTLVEIFFGGSTPANIKKGIELFVGEENVATVLENFLDARREHSVYDISDQFGFLVDFELTDHISRNFADIGIKLDFLLRLVKPAHTLFVLRFLFFEEVTLVKDADDTFYRPGVNDHSYDDARRFCLGVEGRDRLGHNSVRSVVLEDHSGMAGTALYTELGPLSKDQTEPELAEIADVTVLVNGDPVDIDSIDASFGVIHLVDSVLTTDTVVVSYYYWAGQTELPMVLNDIGMGSADYNCSVSKYPTVWVLNEVVPKSPQQVTWHYGAFERGYSAVLNDPTSLLLNEPNHKVSDPETGHIYGQRHVLNWGSYARSYESPSAHVLNEGTPIIEFKESYDPIFLWEEEATDPPMGWAEDEWGSGAWGGP